MTNLPQSNFQDMQALVEACFEQGMKPHEVIHQMREFDYRSLRDTVDILKTVAVRSTNPAVVAVREQVLAIGTWRPTLATSR